MNARKALSAGLACVALAAIAVPSHALTCYLVFDRSDNVTYRDVYPPVDLSDAGRAERDAMRRRGEYLMFMESDLCPRIEYFTGSAGTTGLKLDQTSAPGTASRESTGAAPATTPRAPRKPRSKPAG
ncbi:MAG TPA: hypothetical protein VNG69_11655 [Casimicrobiaceae bacterium]|nr:hypothetical protein [Casimicrobiaceae bacterium]